MSEPRINATLSSEADPLQLAGQRALIVNLSGAAPGLYTDIPNDLSWRTTFNTFSPLTKAIDAFKSINTTTPLDVISIAEPAGATQSTATITFTYPSPTSEGEVIVSIGSRKFNTYKILVAVGDTQNDIAQAVADSIDFDTTSSVGVTVADNVITLESIIAGAQFNNIGIEVKTDVPGLTPTFTKFSGGTGLPNVATIFNVVGNIRYQTVTGPYEWGTDYITNFLDPRFNKNNQILDGVGILTSNLALAPAIVELNTLNSPSLVYFWNRYVDRLNEYNANEMFEFNEVVSAYFAGARSLRLTSGADLSDVVVGAQANDLVGGASLAGKPYANTPFPNLPLIDRDKIPDLDEFIGINNAGGSIFSNNISFTEVVCGRVMTTYKKDTVGLDDKTFQFLNAVDCSVLVRELYFNDYKETYAQTRLTEGSLIANTAMTNTDAIKARTVAIYNILGQEPFVLVQVDQNLLKEFKDKLVVTLEDIQQGRVRISMRIKPISQLRTIDLPIEVVFNTL